MDSGIMNTDQHMARLGGRCAYMFDWHGQPGWLSQPGKLGRTDGWLANRNVGMAHELPMNCNAPR